ncbi:MAG: diacylglycerol kinase family protein [Bacillota bacterium]
MEAPGRGPQSHKPGLSDRHGRARSPVLRSFVYAWAGLSYVYRTQPNMRIHVLTATLAGAACMVTGVGTTDVLMVVLAIAGVMLAEVVNTVAESLTDLLEPHLNPIAKVIKDVAAAGVLLSAAFSVLIAALVFWPTLPTLGDRLRSFLDSRLTYFGVYLVLVILPSLAGLALSVTPPIRGKPGP